MMGKFELIYMRLKIWWLTRKVRKMKKLRAKSQQGMKKEGLSNPARW